jgi:hypothetical protein
VPDADAPILVERDASAVWRVAGFNVVADADLAHDLYVALRTSLIGVMLTSDHYPGMMFELIGLRPPAAGWLVQWERDSPGLSPVRFSVRRMRGYVRGSAVFAEVAWSPSGASVDRLVNVTLAPTGNPGDAELRRARRALTVLLSMRSDGGRPPGANPDPDPLFPIRYGRAVAALWRRGQTDIPMRTEMAAEIGCSLSTYRRRCDHYRLPAVPVWPPPSSILALVPDND